MPKWVDHQLYSRLGSSIGIMLCIALLYGVALLGKVTQKHFFFFLMCIISCKAIQEWMCAAYKKWIIFCIGFVWILLGLFSIEKLFQAQTLWPVLGIAMATDTLAYLCGAALQGPKLCPAISPHKTWSGMLCSLFLVTLGGFLCGYGFLRSMLLCLSAQIGDWLQSYAKRRLGIKDMGTCFPGHGGLLDRIDSWLMAAIVAYFF